MHIGKEHPQRSHRIDKRCVTKLSIVSYHRINTLIQSIGTIYIDSIMCKSIHATFKHKSICFVLA